MLGAHSVSKTRIAHGQCSLFVCQERTHPVCPCRKRMMLLAYTIVPSFIGLSADHNVSIYMNGFKKTSSSYVELHYFQLFEKKVKTIIASTPEFDWALSLRI